MKTLNLEEMEMVEGGRQRADLVEAACYALAGGEIVFAAGVLGNMWNPVGWGWGLTWLIADAGCFTYAVLK